MQNSPFSTFKEWYELACRSEPEDPNAMALATVDTQGVPNVRMVLLKGFNERGFVFYTNTHSVKGRELEAHSHAALCLHWKSLRRQIRARGPVERVTDQDADEYFASRTRISQIGAWASNQSQVLTDRKELEAAVNTQTQRFGDGPIPRPPHWTGFRIIPSEIEFWQDRDFRLHERVRWEKGLGGWTQTALYP